MCPCVPHGSHKKQRLFPEARTEVLNRIMLRVVKNILSPKIPGFVNIPSGWQSDRRGLTRHYRAICLSGKLII
jgi:hypothetical protein